MILPSTYWGGELNRCTITTKNGPMLLSVPIRDSRKMLRGLENGSQRIEDIEICFMHAWQRQHWTAIFSAYGKTPYFDYYADYIRPIFEKQPKWLADLNNETNYILRCLLENRQPGPETERVEALHKPGILDLLFEYGPEAQLRL